ncbi:antirestriction protein ArdA [Streptomyces griseoincarnatus]
MLTVRTLTPRAWIGCLACYNAGDLVGDWFDADVCDLVTPADLHGRETSHEELWVMDHDGFAGALSGECSPVEAAEIAEILSGLSEDEAAPFGVWVEVYGQHAQREHWVDQFRDAYRGEWDSEADFAEDWAETFMEPEEKARMSVWPYNSIDWEYASKELFTGGFSSEDAPGGRVYVFMVA